MVILETGGMSPTTTYPTRKKNRDGRGKEHKKSAACKGDMKRLKNGWDITPFKEERRKP